MTQDGLNIMGYNRAAVVDLVKGGLNPLVAVLACLKKYPVHRRSKGTHRRPKRVADPFFAG